MSFIDNIADFLTDGKRRLSAKAAFVITVITVVFLVDNQMQFTYNYKIQRKIEELTQLNNIIKDPLADSATKFYAITLRDEISNNKTIIDYVRLFFFKKSSTKDNTLHVNNPADNAHTREVPIFNYLMSSCGLICIFGFLVIIVGITKNGSSSLITKIGTAILALVIFSAIAFLFSAFLSLIPVLSKKTYLWNYIINYSTQVIAIGSLCIRAYISSKRDKLKTQSSTSSSLQ